MAPFAFMNNQFVPLDEAKISIRTNALHYGTGIFEESAHTGMPTGSSSSSSRWRTTMSDSSEIAVSSDCR